MKKSGARSSQKTVYDQTCSQRWIKKDINQSNLINYCQRDNCKEWSNNVKRLELRYLDWRIPVFIKFITKITKLQKYPSRYAVLQWEMMEVMMLMHGSILPATTNPPPLPPFRHILGHFQPFRAGAGDFFWGGPGQRAASRRRKAARRHLNRAVRDCSRGRKNLESMKHLGNIGSLYTRA